MAAVLVAGTLFAAVPACAELDTIGQPVSTTAATSSHRYVGTEDAAMRLRNARVSRDVSCDTVGQYHRYTNLDAALEARGKDSKHLLEACRTGVGDAPLEACIANVKSQPCGVLLDRIDGLASCRAADMCLPR